MADRIPETKHEESYKRIKNDFSNVPDEELRALYWKFCSRLERDAVVFDFIPILAEKTVRNHLRYTNEFPVSDHQHLS